MDLPACLWSARGRPLLPPTHASVWRESSSAHENAPRAFREKQAVVRSFARYIQGRSALPRLFATAGSHLVKDSLSSLDALPVLEMSAAETLVRPLSVLRCA